MKTSKKPLDIRCTLCLLPVLVIVIILEPAGLLFTGIFLWILSRTSKKGKGYKGARRVGCTEDWLSDDAVNKPQWCDNNSFSSSSSNSVHNDLVSNPAYSHLSSNIFHRH
jgi:hypothetical protein